MNRYHQEILGLIRKTPVTKLRHHDSTYSGSPRKSYGLSIPATRALSKKWTQDHKDIKLSHLLDLLNSLYQSDSQEERSIAGQILQYLPQLRAQIEPKYLDIWLEQLEGWGEVDGLCQSVFTPKDLLSNWKRWEKIIRSFALSPNPSKQRASLVLLTKSVARSTDPSLSNLAFKNIETLKREKSILITKAISWLLRKLIRHHRLEVEFYLTKNIDSLPKIAIRETLAKLRTGKK